MHGPTCHVNDVVVFILRVELDQGLGVVLAKGLGGGPFQVGGGGLPVSPVRAAVDQVGILAIKGATLSERRG